MKATLEIPDDLYRAIKTRAASQNRKVKELVADALRSFIEKADRDRQPVGQRASPFPLLRGKAGPLLKILENSLIAQLQEEEDIERLRRASGR